MAAIVRSILENLLSAGLNQGSLSLNPVLDRLPDVQTTALWEPRNNTTETRDAQRVIVICQV